MTTVYGMMDSGNCYKPRLLMAKLGRPFKHVEVSSHDGGTRSEAFTAKNPGPQLLFARGAGVVATPEARYVGEGKPYLRLTVSDAVYRAVRD